MFGQDINIDITKVIDVANTLDGINNQIESSFSSVTEAMTSLNAHWDGKASATAMERFASIKSQFCDYGGRKDVFESYVSFLKSYVQEGYVRTEDTNTKLADMFN